ncbi:hypothetical protein HF313_22875 [Massilia atriviolacea]|uniref:Uncharacterized protein n=1 Tax=Massilia atriviolacea TaxID=2495579 RepID=A0A430HCK2_9BURK|nr:hypothetical protein [Massilia atriviolacea]RSZ55242.1 hypothetical protein EJB06_30420 [Massilia atriviolacea]
MNGTVDSPPCCESLQVGELWDLHHAIACLDVEVERILRSQITMRRANQALRSGRDDTLRSMHFADDHIVELRSRVEMGRNGFPEYVFRNNINLIRSLRRQQAELTRQLAGMPGHIAGSNLIRSRRRIPYVCVTDNPGAVPFLAAYIPFIR